MCKSELQLDVDSVLPPFGVSTKQLINPQQDLYRFRKLGFKVERFGFRKRIIDFVAGGRPPRAAQQDNQDQRKDISCHDQPLRKDDLNRGFLSSDPISLCREFGILKNQYAANWNPNVAHGRLPKRFRHRAINKNISPWPGVNLDRNVE